MKRLYQVRGIITVTTQYEVDISVSAASSGEAISIIEHRHQQQGVESMIPMSKELDSKSSISISASSPAGLIQ